MAAYRRRTSNTYNVYGNVAYSPAYDGNAVRVPKREEELHRAPRPRRREQVRREERAKVQVREAGAVAPFAAVGFLAVALFAAMLVMSYAQLAVANEQMVSLRRELSDLKAENVTLSAQYEKAFDLAVVQSAVGEDMVRPSGEQVVYIDLSAPDTVTVYREEGGILNDLKSLAGSVGGFFGDMIEYFR